MSATFYGEYAGAARHAGRVACVWAQQAGDEPHVQRVVPDGCVDVLLFGADLQVAGPDTRPMPARLAPGTRITGVRFRPGQAPGVLGLPLDALRDQRVPLAELWGTAADRIAEEVTEAVAAERSAAAEMPAGGAGAAAADGAVRGAGLGAGAARTLERLVLAHAEGPADPAVAATARALCPGGEFPRVAGVSGGGDGFPRVAGAADGVSRVAGGGDGFPRVAGVADVLGLSERQLRRRCLTAFGYGPKTLQRVVRFQRALRAAREPGADLAGVAYRFGYADQAHLSRDVRALAGVPLTTLI
ncbi:MAG TPA: helix-turn-helix transcriptional regulator [Streptosporangiaceae bacterium]